MPAPKRPLPDWLTPEVQAQLGVVPDAEIAAKVNRRPSSVTRWRRLLVRDRAIPARGQRVPAPPAWLTPAVQALLATHSDRDVAQVAGVSHRRIGEWRRRLVGNRDRVRWEEVEGLGVVPDREIADRLGLSVETVKDQRQKRGMKSPTEPRPGIDWDAQPLGAIPDLYLARQLGVNPATVRSARTSRGIAAAPREARFPAPRKSNDDQGVLAERIVDELAERGPVTSDVLGAAVGRALGSIERELRLLEGLGLVVRDGRCWTLR